MAAIVSKVIDDGSRRLHIQRIGFPAHAAPDLPPGELLPLIAAAQLCADRPAEAAGDPTAEEMLAVGMALGMCEAERARRMQPRVSAWRLAARLGM